MSLVGRSRHRWRRQVFAFSGSPQQESKGTSVTSGGNYNVPRVNAVSCVRSISPLTLFEDLSQFLDILGGPAKIELLREQTRDSD